MELEGRGLLGLVKRLLLFMVIFVPVFQRLLGVRFGLVRLGVAAVLYQVVITPMVIAMVGSVAPEDPSIAQWSLFVLAVLCSVLVGLVFLVLAEAIVLTGSLPWLRDLRRDVGGRVTRTRRYLQILRIAIRHGLGPYLRGRRQPGRESAAGQADLARSLRLALEGSPCARCTGGFERHTAGLAECTLRERFRTPHRR